MPERISSDRVEATLVVLAAFLLVGVVIVLGSDPSFREFFVRR